MISTIDVTPLDPMDIMQSRVEFGTTNIKSRAHEKSTFALLRVAYWGYSRAFGRIPLLDFRPCEKPFTVFPRPPTCLIPILRKRRLIKVLSLKANINLLMLIHVGLVVTWTATACTLFVTLFLTAVKVLDQDPYYLYMLKIRYINFYHAFGLP